MKVILSEASIRRVVYEAFKASEAQGGSNYTSKTSSASVTLDSGNFKYEDILDQSSAVKAKAELSNWNGKKETDPAVKEKLKQYWVAAGPPFQERQTKQSKINHPGALRLYLL
jgi:hypothetical protein